ncbi:hypothetical protein RF11_01380 [Thelohanellus kitauei]|uniref:Uncharacterized protein n=1 Tax=Thelohanellus kitauei TaxID=669202 RepID=A0A0C2MWV5_THEKT|nr:hypothetical protein RF11_01380 [Thelohanellus kitauei]
MRYFTTFFCSTVSLLVHRRSQDLCHGNDDRIINLIIDAFEAKKLPYCTIDEMLSNIGSLTYEINDNIHKRLNCRLDDPQNFTHSYLQHQIDCGLYCQFLVNEWIREIVTNNPYYTHDINDRNLWDILEPYLKRNAPVNEYPKMIVSARCMVRKFTNEYEEAFELINDMNVSFLLNILSYLPMFTTKNINDAVFNTGGPMLLFLEKLKHNRLLQEYVKSLNRELSDETIKDIIREKVCKYKPCTRPLKTDVMIGFIIACASTLIVLLVSMKIHLI